MYQVSIQVTYIFEIFFVEANCDIKFYCKVLIYNEYFLHYF